MQLSPKVLTAPPFITLYYAVVIVLARDVLSFTFLNWLFGPLFVLGGLTIIVWANQIFKRVKTTINPFKVRDASSLVTSGPFKYSRNPMYLGMALILTGVTIWGGTLLGFALVALFIQYINRAQIDREEKAMAQLFGDEWAEYKGRVRAWV